MLGTSLDDCTVSESPEFAQAVAEPLQLPDCFTTTEEKVDIIGVTRFSGKYLRWIFGFQYPEVSLLQPYPKKGQMQGKVLCPSQSITR